VPTNSPTVAVVSPKGGNGKTTLSVNLAVALARHAPTILIDLDIFSGDIEYALQLHPIYRLDDIVRRHEHNTTENLELLLTAYSRNLDAVCAPNTPVVADQLNPVLSLKAVDQLLKLERPTVLDTGAGVGPLTIGALDRATHVALVSSTDVSSIHASRKLLDTMTQLAMDMSRVSLIINRSNARVGLTTSDVEEVLGLKAALKIPEHENISASINSGVPITESDPSSSISLSFFHYANQIMGAPAPPTKNRFHFGGKK